MASLNGKDKLYHGTSEFFDEIDLRCAKPFKDFGRGFYLTSLYFQAARWAYKRSSSKYYVYEFEINVPAENTLSILDLTSYNQKWLDYVSLNRTTDTADVDFDIVFDKMADNRAKNIAPIIYAYQASKISTQEAIDKLKWPREDADQYCFKTQQAIQYLKLAKCIQFPERIIVTPAASHLAFVPDTQKEDSL